jgi:ABC-2 type transport system ATP-binding protein
LIHEPKILLLDEPTTGVDPVSRREFWEILAELNLAGTTILVSTPYMDEADRCGRVGLIYAGRLVICDTPMAIRGELPGDLLELQPEDWRATRALVAELPGVIQVQTYGETLHVVVDSAEERLPELKQALEDNEIGFRSIRPALPRMEEAFISLINQLESEDGL